MGLGYRLGMRISKDSSGDSSALPRSRLELLGYRVKLLNGLDLVGLVRLVQGSFLLDIS